MKSRILLGLSLVAMVLFWGVLAPAYVINKTTTGKEMYWTQWPMKYKIHNKGLPGVSASGVAAAIRAGYKTWDAVSCAYISFSDQGSTSQSSGNSKDHINTSYVPSGWNPSWGSNALAVTTPYYDPSSGIIIDADIAYNPTKTWATNGSSKAIDVQGVATHEIGHQMGMGHSANTAATMYYATGSGNTSQRSLHSDDIAGICYLYNNGKPKPPECTTNSHCAPGEICKNQQCIPGNKKGYGAPCTDGGDCTSGLCIKSSTSTYCTQYCNSSACPNGDKCVNLSGGGKACLPNSASTGTKKLGQTCASNLECISDICVQVPGQGYLCSQKCTVSKNDCPTGYTCANSTIGGLCIPGTTTTKKDFGAACTANSQCKSGTCGVTSKGRICTSVCDMTKKNCPSGYKCEKLPSNTVPMCVKDSGTTPTKKDLGEPCKNAADCKSALCANTGSGLVCIQYCDLSKNNCPTGFKCVPISGSTKGACVKDTSIKPPKKGKLGDPCTKGDECESGLCATDSQGNKFCTNLCDPKVGCGSGYTCDSAGGGKYACSPTNSNRPPNEGGCSVARIGDLPCGGTWLLLALPLLFIFRRRR